MDMGTYAGNLLVLLGGFFIVAIVMIKYLRRSDIGHGGNYVLIAGCVLLVLSLVLPKIRTVTMKDGGVQLDFNQAQDIAGSAVEIKKDVAVLKETVSDIVKSVETMGSGNDISRKVSDRKVYTVIVYYRPFSEWKAQKIKEALAKDSGLVVQSIATDLLEIKSFPVEAGRVYILSNIHDNEVVHKVGEYIENAGVSVETGQSIVLSKGDMQIIVG